MAHRIETITVKGSPMEVFLFEPGGPGPHPGLVLCQHIPFGHAGLENDEFTLKTAQRYADSGYFGGGAVGRLIRAGIDTCVPDCNTAGDLHRGQAAGTIRAQGRGQVAFAYDPEADRYRCPAGNELRRVQRRVEAGQELVEYRAQRPCRGCPWAAHCLTQKQAQYRMLKVSEYEPELTAARERFNEPEPDFERQHRFERAPTEAPAGTTA